MVDPIDYTAGLDRAISSGARLGGLIGLATQQQLENKKAADAQALAKQFQADWQSSFGDPKKMTELVAKYPGQLAAIKQGIGFQDEQHQLALGNAARDLRIAMASGNPQAIGAAASRNAGVLGTINSSPEEILQQYQQDPQALASIVDAVGLSALGPKDYYGVQNDRAQRANDQATLAERIRSNQAGEALQARGQDIQVRGQNISAQNAKLSASGATSDMKNFSAYSSLLKTDPEAAALFAQVAGINTGVGAGNRQVQLSDGRTVSIGGKLHGAGANAFYEGRDNNGNTVRVPANAIASPATSAATAQNYAMKKDIDTIEAASPDDLNFITGVTGGNGTPALGADVRSRISGKEQRQIYNATQRIQGRMQNQGIAAARDMGASGINTVAEAKMYFQGMPQIDFSSPESAQQSVKDIKTYTDNYNQQYNVNVGTSRQPVNQQSAQQPAGGIHTSKSGITFTVK